jgi:hypothetical protein
MILNQSDFPGSLADKPEYMRDYDKNQSLFLQEIARLDSLQPGHHGWLNSLFSFQVYADNDGYRVALPSHLHPVKVCDGRYFQDYLLSQTVFPNRYQAATIAARIMQQKMGN